MGPRPIFATALGDLPRHLANLFQQLSEEVLERWVDLRRRGILVEERLELALVMPVVSREPNSRADRVHHRFRFPHELRKVLRNDAVRFARRVPGSELILMHVANVGEQFE